VERVGVGVGGGCWQTCASGGPSVRWGLTAATASSTSVPVPPLRLGVIILLRQELVLMARMCHSCARGRLLRWALGRRRGGAGSPGVCWTCAAGWLDRLGRESGAPRGSAARSPPPPAALSRAPLGAAALWALRGLRGCRARRWRPLPLRRSQLQSRWPAAAQAQAPRWGARARRTCVATTRVEASGEKHMATAGLFTSTLPSLQPVSRS
jgi:hypothetical protein